MTAQCRFPIPREPRLTLPSQGNLPRPQLPQQMWTLRDVPDAG